MPEFFLDAEGGQFAFLKEDDEADWSQAIYRSQTSPDAEPSDQSDADVLDTTSIRSVTCLVKPTSATFKMLLKGWQQANNIPDFYVLPGGDLRAGFSDKLSLHINVQGVDAFYPQITEIDGTEVEVEYAPLPYES